MVRGKRFFKCPPAHGVLVPLQDIGVVSHVLAIAVFCTRDHASMDTHFSNSLDTKRSQQVREKGIHASNEN